ncbi:hypothetical protein ACVWZA_001451 [Sphingomonas sp. UYAg733]
MTGRHVDSLSANMMTGFDGKLIRIILLFQ